MRLRKADAEALLGAIDQDHLTDLLAGSLGRLLGDPSLGYDAALGHAATIGRWTPDQLTALYRRDPAALSALAVALSELRAIPKECDLTRGN